MNKVLNKFYVGKLKEQAKSSDTETAHSNADDLLCDLLVRLGYGEVVEEYHEVDKWFA